MNEELLQRGLVAHRSGQFAAAADAYREALDQAPEDHRAMHFLALALKDEGKLDDALEWVERAITADDQTAGYFQTLGEIQHRRGDTGGALVNMEQALTLDPNLPQGHNTLGYLQWQAGQLESAEKTLRMAARLDPDSHEAFTNLGAVYLAQGRIDDARSEFQRALAIKPDSVAARASLGAAFLQEGAAGFAAECFRACLKQAPGDLRLQTQLAQATALSGQLDDARALLEGVLEARPEDADALTAMGDVEMAAQHYAAAMARYQEAIKVRQGHAPTIEKLGDAALARGQAGDAMICYQALHQRDPNRPGLATRLAKALFAGGKPDDAQKMLKQRLASDAGDTEATVELARQLATRGEAAKARDYLDSVPSAAQSDSGVRKILTESYLAEGNVEAAAKALGANSTGALDPLLTEFRGRIQDAREDYEGAFATFSGLVADLKLPPAEIRSETAAPSEWSDYAATAVDDGRGDPLLLVGLPGSGVDAVARALAASPNIDVFDDRFGNDPRQDLLVRKSKFAGNDITEIQLARRRYWSALRRLRTKFGDRVAGVDWLPTALFDPIRIAKAFPQAHVIVVTRDATDLKWHAESLGWRQHAATTAIDIEDFEGILQAAREHSELRIETVDFDALRRGDASALEAVFAGYDVPVTGVMDALDGSLRTAMGLPLYWPPGHGAHYAKMLD